MGRSGSSPERGGAACATRVRIGRALQGSVAARARVALVRRAAGDLRYGLRTLGAAKGFTFVAVAMLAIAIGANTAVFSVLDAVLFRVLPVNEPHELRELAWVEGGFKGWSISYDGSMRPYPGGRRIAYSFSYPMYVNLRDRSTCVQRSVSLQRSEPDRRAGRPRRAGDRALVVSGNFASALGVGTSLGRPISPEDDRPGAPPVAVLTNTGWQRLFGGDPRAVGQTITINGAPAVIVGVTPPSFFGLEPGLARRHARAGRSDDAGHRARPRRAQQSEVLGVSRDGPRAAGCRRCAGPGGNRGVDAPGAAGGAPRAES